jgi:Spy/CpxP family protein refolding chaperone
MKSLKTGMVIAGLLIGTATMAQERTGGKTPEERATIRTEWMTKELSLTDAQQTQVASINLADAQQNETIRKDAALTEDQKKQAWKTSREAHKAKLKEVLTAEQFAALEAKKEERMHEHKADGKAHASDKTAAQKAEFRTDKLAEELSLTEDQKAKALQINTATLEKIEAIRKDTSLTEDQQEKAIRENRAEQMKQFKAILTPEQRAKLKEKKEEHKSKHPKK